jgi:cyclophilin family peptidyl-prolyl cis-trans isomerase
MKRILAGVLVLGVLGIAMSGTALAQTKAAGAVKTKPVEDKALQAIDAQIAKLAVDKTKSDWRTKLTIPTVATFEKTHQYFARMVTNKGTVLIKFMPDVAPMHVTNFIYLTRLGFYDGISFHRVIPKFMAQGGCPLGTGMGGPGYTFGSEIDPKVKHERPGMLSMANTGRPNTDGSQFFLTFAPTAWLDGKHTIFGEVVEGMDTLKALEACGTAPNGTTTEPLKMEKVTIEVK